MDRHTFLRAQEWLEPTTEQATPQQAAPPQSPPVATAFAGAASLHVSHAEQFGGVARYAGPLATDALHLSFATDGGLDPMQLRLAVGVARHAAAAAGGAPRPRDVQLELDGARYLLDLRAASRLVLPDQLLPLLPPALARQLDAGAAGAEGPPPFLAAAPPCSLPFLTLVFPHVCFTMYPLGYKAAAAHVSRDHDAAELARLALLLTEGRQQQLQSGPRQQGAPADRADGWAAAHSQLLQHVRAAAAAAAQLLTSGCSEGAQHDAAMQQAAWRELAAAAGHAHRAAHSLC